MKRLFLLLTLVLAIHTSWAQDTPRAKKCVAEVRKQYAAAKERSEREEKEEYAPKENMTVNLNYIIPGCGPTAETLHYLFTAKDGEEPGVRTYQPLLITRKYNVAARQMYEEYLFDGRTDGRNHLHAFPTRQLQWRERRDTLLFRPRRKSMGNRQGRTRHGRCLCQTAGSRPEGSSRPTHQPRVLKSEPTATPRKRIFLSNSP